MSLLVLDDDPALCNAVRRHLRGLVDVVAVPSRGALEQLLGAGNRRFVAALLDVHLGSTDPEGGLHAYTRLRAADPSLPIVFFTA